MNTEINQTADGKKFAFLTVEAIMTDELKAFEFKSRNQLITTVTDEFSAVCPFSGLPDVAKLIIEYRPISQKCIELKSLKYYITSFRNVGLYQEGCTKRIYDDLYTVLGLDDNNLKVTTIYNVRGGFTTTCQEGKIRLPYTK
jgi:7-cyano-7-deazaguanine reductase